MGSSECGSVPEQRAEWAEKLKGGKGGLVRASGCPDWQLIAQQPEGMHDKEQECMAEKFMHAFVELC